MAEQTAYKQEIKKWGKWVNTVFIAMLVIIFSATIAFFFFEITGKNVVPLIFIAILAPCAFIIWIIAFSIKERWRRAKDRVSIREKISEARQTLETVTVHNDDLPEA